MSWVLSGCSTLKARSHGAWGRFPPGADLLLRSPHPAVSRQGAGCDSMTEGVFHGPTKELYVVFAIFSVEICSDRGCDAPTKVTIPATNGSDARLGDSLVR